MYQGIGIYDAQKLASPCSKKREKLMGMWGEVVDDTKGKARLITTIYIYMYALV